VSTALFHAHSGLRYLVLLAALVALAYLLRGWMARRPWDKAARVVGAVFTGLLDLQALLGIGVALARPWQRSYIGHVATMLLALVAAHALGGSARRLSDDRARYGRALLAVVVPVLLIIAGIVAIGRRVV
jgi:hypothetical protein